MELTTEIGKEEFRASLRERYLAGEPFPHLVLENFLPEGLLRGLLKEFPAFDPRLAVSENGVVGGKMVRSDLRDLGPSFRALDDILSGPDFVQLLSAVTGIEGLFADATFEGGGAHCSLPGQELDSHLDFNVHPHKGWRRRVNVLLYLNPDWKSSDGGSLELHSDPRSPWKDQVVSVAPLANRLVFFETNDVSWHGHGKLAATRRSVAAYYYTAEVSSTEAGLPHSTVYVDRPLTGAETPEEITAALERRREHLARLLKIERELLTLMSEMNEGAGNALAKLKRGMDVQESIAGLDSLITGTYERESQLRGLVEAIGCQIDALYFLAYERAGTKKAKSGP